MKMFLCLVIAAVLVAVRGDDDVYITAVKAAIDQYDSDGTCADITSNDNCSDDASFYYDTFEYSDYRVVVTFGIPSHDAEFDTSSRAYRCERYQFALLKTNPEFHLQDNFVQATLGATAYLSTGALLYDPRSNIDGSLADYYESENFDPCWGHSDGNNRYHYHGVPLCIDGADDFTQCVELGYYQDGFKMHGLCNDGNGNELLSCYVLNDGEVGDNESDYTWDEEAYNAGTCHLDEASGYWVDDDTYIHVLTSNYPLVPRGAYSRRPRWDKACGFSV